MIRLAALAGLLMLAAAAQAETLRIATFNAALSRDGPGILLRDIERGEDAQIAAVIAVIQTVRPGILLLSEFDYDAGGRALSAFQDRLAAGPDGLSLPYSFLDEVNTGQPSGLDLNGDGRLAGPADAHGFGRFPGQYGMAVLSRYPIDADASRRFRLLRWADLPWADLPQNADGTPFPSAAVHAAMRLSSKAHWDVAVALGDETLRLWVSHPTPPVFDGPEDQNGRRNHDEIAFWRAYMTGEAFETDAGTAVTRTSDPFVIIGDLNADPEDGDGRRGGIRALLGDPMLQDPRPRSAGGVAAAAAQGGANDGQRGDPALDTADWRDDAGPGNLRVDFVLPSAGLTVEDAGVFWPETGPVAATASDHRLVWVDILH